MKRIMIITSLILASAFFVNCATSSMEFTTAKTALRSERNLQKAEEWFIKALDVEPENALIPYILATEIYRPQKKWAKMADMLTEAMERNPNQKLERPFMMDNKPIITIEDGVLSYRKQEWVSIFNKGIELFQAQKMDEAIEKLSLAMKLDPSNPETYSTLGMIFTLTEDYDKAQKMAYLGLQLDPNHSKLLKLSGDIAINDKDFTNAIELYKRAIDSSDNVSASLIKLLIYTYIDIGEYQSAIDYSLDLISKNPDEADAYFNVGVMYQRLGANLYNPAIEEFNTQSETRNLESLTKILTDLKQAKSYFSEARDYFLEASDLEIEDSGAYDAAKNMKENVKQLDTIFIPSVQDMLKQ
jgi:tetratricopeptide (TPR) repeat protein